MYGYFANKSKHKLIFKNIYKNMTIYLKNRIYIVIRTHWYLGIESKIVPIPGNSQLTIHYISSPIQQFALAFMFSIYIIHDIEQY